MLRCRKRGAPLAKTTTNRSSAEVFVQISSSGSCDPFCTLIEAATTFDPVESKTYKS